MNALQETEFNLLKIFVETKVIIILKTIITVRKVAEISPAAKPPTVTKNIEIIEIIIGKRPLQGTKLLVSIASIRSRFESIILQPITPAALHPKPIQVYGRFYGVFTPSLINLKYILIFCFLIFLSFSFMYSP